MNINNTTQHKFTELVSHDKLPFFEARLLSSYSSHARPVKTANLCAKIQKSKSQIENVSLAAIPCNLSIGLRF